ncbi:MAG: M6 family metalloprotease domain-containing protein [Prevotella sp.]|nr:M6 family metalloprotease domain-containing protein [Prevotella sp.]MCM1074785.1 M6 family metalloprotease domain-containing protein [Ruminococcus sp.]
MTRKLYRTLAALAFAGVSLPMLAVPARPGAVTHTQPDGSVVTLSLRGDEHFHYYQDEEGYIVEQQQDGWYRILDNAGKATKLTPGNFNLRSDADKAEIMAIRPQKTFEALKARNSDLMRSCIPRRSAAYRADARIAGAKWDNADGHDLRAIPTDGERPVLVILVNFSDLKWSFADNPQAEMKAMLNEPGYTGNHCNGSVRDFFLHSSNGIYQPRFDVYGPVELGKPYSYYGRNSNNGQDGRAYEMVSDACALLDGEIDFSIYDTNGDGYVDNVYVYYAGYGENESAGADYVWPHAWNLSYAMPAPEHDGVKIDHYACSNELTLRLINNDPKTHSGIGTFCHEFSHVLGLPDLYATNYSGAFTPGSFSTMDHGSYNNDSRTPPLYSIYEKYALEWEKPIDITEGAEVTMLPTVDGGNAYRITVNPNRPTEYFLFENRQQHDRDKYIPGHGMLVWHIDFDKSIWERNVVNDNPDHQYVDIVEADGRGDEGSQTGDPFPGTSSRSEFSAQSQPSFTNWNGSASSLPLTNINEDTNGAISFRVGDGGTADSPLYISAPTAVLTNVDNSSLSFKWEPVVGAEKYYVNVMSMYFDDLFGSLETESPEEYTFADLGNSTEVTLKGLTPGKSYQVSLYAASEKNISKVSQGFYSTFASEMANVIPLLSVTPGDTYADLKWYEVPGADSYEVTVATRTEGEPQLGETVNWNNNVYPYDWYFPGGSFDNRAEFSGQSAPSLVMNPGTVLSTGIYNEDINALEFWARSNVDGGAMSLVVYAVEPNSTLTHLAEITSLPCDAKGSTVRFGDFPNGVHQLLIVYTCRTAGMTVNLDDINIYYAADTKDTPIAGYDAYNVNGTSLKAEGLTPFNDYVAYIRSVASDGTNSAYSKTVRFTTADPADIDEITNAADFMTFNNGIVTCGSSMSIYNIDGTPVAVNTVGSVQLPTRGIYLVTSAGKTQKIVW